MEKRWIPAVLIACIVQGTCPASPASTGVVPIESCTALEWEGTPDPVLGEHRNPAGQTNAAVLFTTQRRRESTWSRSGEWDFSATERLAVRLATPRAVKATLFAESGEGHFARELELTRGEQVLLVPLGAFARRGVPTGWGNVTRLGLTLGPQRRDVTVALLGISGLAEGVAFQADGLFLSRPVSPIAAIGASWPIYSILDLTEYPERGERADRTLQGTLKAMYGVQLPLNPEGLEPGVESANVVLLGADAALAAGTVTEEELARQGYSGFILRAADGIITIAGQSRHGTLYGAYRLLEKEGCRFIYHGRHQVPQKAQRTIQACEILDKPFFSGKRMGGWSYNYAMGRDVMGDPRGAAKIHGEADLFDKTLWIDHTSPYLVPKLIYHDEHPEYYALRGDGTRLPKETSDVRMVTCTTHPDVLKISAQRMLRWIETQQDRQIFVCMQADDHEWCRCDGCLAMVYEPGNYSDAMLYWVNHVAKAVAKKYPDKILMCHAYGPTQPAPVKLKPEKNVHVMYAAWPNGTSAPCGIRDFDAPENVLARTQIMDWLKVAPGQIGLYDYNSGGRYTLNGMSWKVKWCARNNMVGFWYCGGNKSFQALWEYVQARLNWNPFLEVENLKRAFIPAYYGDAAPVMGTIIDRIYDRIEYGNYDSRMHGYPPADFFEPAFVEEMLALFDKAIAISGQREDIISDRGYFRSNCLRATRPGGREYRDEELEVFSLCFKEYIAEWLRNHEEAVKLAEEEGKTPPGYAGLANTIWSWTRVRVETDASSDEVPPMVTKLLANPGATIKQNMITDFTERLDDGWRLPAESFTGARYFPNYNWKCEKKNGAVVYGTMTDMSRMTAKLELEAAPPDQVGVLEIDGQDSDKMWCAPLRFQLLVNGQTLFEGPNPFVKRGWSRMQVPLPAGSLREGENTIEIRSQTCSDSLTSHWCMLSEVLIRYADE